MIRDNKSTESGLDKEIREIWKSEISFDNAVEKMETLVAQAVQEALASQDKEHEEEMKCLNFNLKSNYETKLEKALAKQREELVERVYLYAEKTWAEGNEPRKYPESFELSVKEFIDLIKEK